MHGTANQQPQQQQPAAPAPIVTPVAPPVQAPVAPKVDDKELELAKAKAQLEMMRKKLEAAEQSKATEKQSRHSRPKANITTVTKTNQNTAKKLRMLLQTLVDARLHCTLKLS